VIEAVTNNQKILIYGDYDVDGTCATALLYMFLKELEANVEYYIPNRIQEGYGISKAGIEYAINGNASLMISVDCGITAIEEAEYAKRLGLDLIICDHHQPKEIIPNAYTVLDPLKPNCHYPFKHLAGAGVAFKLAHGISEKIGKKDLPFKYLDLVALASSADIVPLVDENRILTKAGLGQINTKPRPGIYSLIKKSGMEVGNLSSGQVVFTLAPRINAVGRLSDAKLAVELLITESEMRAKELANILEVENVERRKIDEDTLNAALEIVEASINFKEEVAIVLHEENWHPGVIGIVASRLVEKYYRPTIMLTTIDGVAKGSARSISKFNIYEALKECEDLLIHFGGHQAAAGLAIEIDKLEEFKIRFNNIVRERLSTEAMIPELEIDSKIKISEITPKFLKILDQFKPFGPGNMRPTFLVEDVHSVGYPRVVGNNHLIVSIKQNGCDKVFDCIGFDQGSYVDKLYENTTTFDMVFSIDQMGRDNKIFPQLKIKDLKIKEKNQE
jgi:single-stranded-DNA-specific exonuclease